MVEATALVTKEYIYIITSDGEVIFPINCITYISGDAESVFITTVDGKTRKIFNAHGVFYEIIDSLLGGVL